MGHAARGVSLVGLGGITVFLGLKAHKTYAWQIDANLGGSLTWTRMKETSAGASGGWDETRRQSVTASLNVQPVRILSVKLQYDLVRSEVDASTVGSETGRRWKTDHDLRLRLLIRA